MGALEGNLEVVTHSRIAGWVRDPAAPQTRVSLVISANGSQIGGLTADRFRADLEEAGIGDGCHAFEFAVPAGLAAASPQEIEVCRADDGTHMPGSPTVLAAARAEPDRRPDQPATEVPSGLLRGNLEHVDRRKIIGWAQDDGNGERPVVLVVTANRRVIGRVLANRYRRDLEAAGIGGGRHGFELALPNLLSPFAMQQIRVTREADGAELPGSPLSLPELTGLDETVEQALAETLASIQAADEEQALGLLTHEADRLLARRAERQGGRAEREALRLFRRRWGEPATSDAADFGEAEGLRALVIDTQVPDAGRDGGSLAILSHVRALRAIGYAVSLAAAEAMRETVALEQLAAAEAITVCAAPFYSCVEDVLSRQAGMFDLVYLHRVAIADRYLPLVRRYCPQARILYSVADLHHLRVARQAEIEQRPELLAYSRHLAAVESLAAQRADIVVTHSPVEAELLRRSVGPGKVHVVPFAVAARRTRKPFADRAGLAFIGNAAHPPNGDAVYHLTRDILPLVWQRDPRITCKIVGHGWAADRMPQFDPRIEVAGAVADLDEVFDTVRLTVAPLRFGAGIKGKVLDSFAAGLPCVITPIAAEGLLLTGALARLIADTPAALAELIVSLHRDQAANRQIGDAAARMILDEFSSERVVAALAACTTERWKTPGQTRKSQSGQSLPSVG